MQRRDPEGTAAETGLYSIELQRGSPASVRPMGDAAALEVDSLYLAGPRALDGGDDSFDPAAEALRRGQEQQPLTLGRTAVDRHLANARSGVILIFADYYLPGYKAGGPIRSLSGTVERLNDRFRFAIITRDRDAGDSHPYRADLGDTWHHMGGCRCRYLSPRERTPIALRNAVRVTPHDVQYANSLFSWPLSIQVVLLRTLRLIPRRPLIIAPRGELSPRALGLGRLRKRVYLALARTLGLYRSVLWHAADEDEAGRIRRWFGARAIVHVVSDITASVSPISDPRHPDTRASDHLADFRVVFVSRIVPMKNLQGAMQILAGVRTQVRFTIHGPLEDERYWSRCSKLAASLPANISVSYEGPLAPGQVVSTIAEHDLFLLPSLGESFGHAILEALTAGCPVLISDRTPWRDLEKRRAGWDVPLEDTERFRAIIDSFAAASPQERMRWRRGAAEFARIHLDDETAVAQMAAMFERALAMSEPRAHHALLDDAEPGSLGPSPR